MHAAVLAFGVAAALGSSTVSSWTSRSDAPVTYAAYALSPSLHAILESSVPAAGDTLATLPPELSLRFSGPIEVSGATIHVLGPESRTWSLEARRDPDDSRALVADMPSLEPGGYRVAWRVISADGHPVGGDFVFFVRGADEDVELGEPPPSEAHSPGDHAGAQEDPHVAPPLIVVRSAVDLALLPLAGLLLFAAWGRAPTTVLTDRTMRILSAAAPALTMIYAWLWAGEALGAGNPRLSGLLSLTTGRALAAETALAALVPWALLLARRIGMAAVLALLAVAAGGLGGHPASYTPALSLPASAAHVVAAAIWLGGLAFLVTERGSGDYPLAARRVSAAALASAGVVVVTGVAQSWVMLGSLERLTSTFGLLLLAKGAGFAGLIAFGAYHRLRLVPTMGSPEGATRLSRSVGNELALATCIVVLAALLSHIPPTS
jgi:copper transport protein